MPTHPKRIRFTRHAIDQMRLRSITKEDVRIAIASPDITLPYPGGGTRICSKASSKPIKVGIRDFGTEIVVMTAMNWER